MASQRVRKAAESAVERLLSDHEMKWRYGGIREGGMNAAKIAHRISPDAARAICEVFCRYQMGEFMWADRVFGDGTTPAWLDEPIKL